LHQPLHTSKRWAGNRVAYYENQEDASSQGAKIHYQYDSRGNRTQSLDEATGRKLELMYDSGNQLVRVRVSDNGTQIIQHYRYDAFGRRLAKYSDPADSETGEVREADYFGWDGDRLIHTERFNSANVKDKDGAAQPEVIHTIYEPGSFTPLIQLRRANKAPLDLGEQLLANTSPGVVQDALRKALADIKELSATLPQNIAFQSMSKDVQIFMREQLQEYEQTLSDQRKEAAEKVEIRHYLCDHLGTPNALIREDSRLDWAVQLDAWGNVRAEHNPGELYQPIRLPGQHADEDTGLYYNRHRYYESDVGGYINQDPVGFLGGVNLSIYPLTPLSSIDPLGLWASQKGFYVHQRAGYLVFGNEITQSQLSAVARGHVWADSAQHQTLEFTHMHAMRRPGQSKAEACAATNAYIKEQAQKALNAKSEGKLDDAFFHFGAALHAIQDATSPSHSGFQVWTGDETKPEQWDHVKKELTLPDENGALFQKTKQAWESFKKGDINGFSCQCD
ncbi:RHS repeat-associated core domain-containing protein, partial [Comamonas sp. JUb58]|uniref:RHS repeat-associated core domain-containing protein n=1 Tax=Comamonas sp. JUb58 TaxID=2485114 RepID=UPI0010E4F356